MAVAERRRDFCRIVATKRVRSPGDGAMVQACRCIMNAILWCVCTMYILQMILTIEKNISISSIAQGGGGSFKNRK